MRYFRLIPAFCVLMLAFFATPTFAQTETEPSRWAAQLTFKHQDLVIQPNFGQLGVFHDVKIRPYFAVDVQRFFDFRPHSRTFVSAQLNYFNNLYHNRWMGLQIGLGYEAIFAKRFFASFRMEGGAARVKSSDIRYKYEDGVWVTTQNEDRADIDILLTSRVDVGYRLGGTKYPMDMVGSSHLTISANSRLGLAPYYGLGVGFRVGF